MRCNNRMRVLFLLPIAVATLALGGRSVEQPRGARPVVILVHGRGHIDDDSAALRRLWKRDLDSSLASVGLPHLVDSDVRLAWYADVLDPAFEGTCDLATTAGDSLGLETFARDFFASLANALPKSEAPEARGLLGDILYAVDASKRCAAERRVGGVIEAAAKEHRPIVVVAYSLGALVAYDYLNSRSASEKMISGVRLVTIGSPLGISGIREILGHGSASLRMPPGVSDWDNVYDPNDAFAGAVEPD